METPNCPFPITLAAPDLVVDVGCFGWVRQVCASAEKAVNLYFLPLRRPSLISPTTNVSSGTTDTTDGEWVLMMT